MCGLTRHWSGRAADWIATLPGCEQPAAQRPVVRCMMRPIPTTIRLTVALLVALCINSLAAQLLLVADHHRVSWVAFVAWTSVYAALAIGLVNGVRINFWCAILLSILQLAPAVIWTFADPVALFGAMPSWYPVSIYVSSGLGLGLLTCVVVRPSRDHFHGQPQANV